LSGVIYDLRRELMGDGSVLTQPIRHNGSCKEAPPGVEDGNLDHIPLNDRVAWLATQQLRSSLPEEMLKDSAPSTQIDGIARVLSIRTLAIEDIQDLGVEGNENITTLVCSSIGGVLDTIKGRAVAGKECATGH
jgi:hypothetical protein